MDHLGAFHPIVLISALVASLPAARMGRSVGRMSGGLSDTWLRYVVGVSVGLVTLVFLVMLPIFFVGFISSFSEKTMARSPGAQYVLLLPLAVGLFSMVRAWRQGRATLGRP